MPTSQIATLLTALTAALNANVAGLGAVRNNDATVYRIDVPADGRVVVIPKRQATNLLSRAANAKRLKVDVAFVRNLSSASDAQVDAALAWVETVEHLWDEAGALRDLDLDTYSWIGITRDPIYRLLDVQKLHQFTAALTLEYGSDT